MQAVVTTFRGPTNTRDSRIIAKADAGRLVWPCDDRLSVPANHRAAAEALVRKLDWTHPNYGTLVTGSLPGSGYVHVLTSMSGDGQ